MSTPPPDIWEQALPHDEFDQLVREAISDLDGPEGHEMTTFMAWFKRRYPTPLARLQFSTRQYKQWMKTKGIAFRQDPK